MSVDTASVGDPVASDVANAVPILDTAAPALGPTLNWEPVPDLPPELQPNPGDVLLGKAFWPWEDLGAQGIPEQWLYMSRHVIGTIAQLAVQTDSGPKLVKAQSDGTLIVGATAPPSAPINATVTESLGGSVGQDVFTFQSALAAAATLTVLSTSILGWIYKQLVIEIEANAGAGDLLILRETGSGKLIVAISNKQLGIYVIDLERQQGGTFDGAQFYNQAGGTVTFRGTLFAHDRGLG